jgi:hypothetical protein
LKVKRPVRISAQRCERTMMPIRLIRVPFLLSCVCAVTGNCWGQEKAPPSGPVAGPHSETSPKPRPRITISKATTRIERPVDSEGYVDYVAAMNEMASQAVTADNNGGVLFVRAFGLTGFSPDDRRRFFQMLHCEPVPEKGEYLVDLEQFVKQRRARQMTQREDDDRDDAMERPWSAAQYPLVAQWIEANQKPLELVIQGTRLPKCYFPLILPAGEAPVAIPLPTVEASRIAARLLAARAMLRLKEGKIDQAEQDLLACHRLGRLIGSSPFFIGTLVGIAIDATAWQGDVALMASGKLDAAAALAYQRELRGLAPLPTMADVFDTSERFCYLGNLSVIARSKPTVAAAIDQSLFSILTQTPPPKPGDPPSADWDRIFRFGNEKFDVGVSVLRQQTNSERHRALERFNREMRDIATEAKATDLSTLLLRAFATREAWTDRVAKVCVTLLMPSVEAVSEAEFRMQARLALAQVGFALAAYRADAGTYPAALGELAPRYIAQVPADPFTDQPLHYQRQKDGFLLYSAGANGKDDHGATFSSDPRGDDIVIRIPLAPTKTK